MSATFSTPIDEVAEWSFRKLAEHVKLARWYEDRMTPQSDGDSALSEFNRRLDTRKMMEMRKRREASAKDR